MNKTEPWQFLFSYIPERKLPYFFRTGDFGATKNRAKTLNAAIRHFKKRYSMCGIPDDFYTELRTVFTATKLSLKVPKNMSLKYITVIVVTGFWIEFGIEIPQ